MVTHDTECVVDEEGGDVMHVVSKLPVCFGYVGFFTGGGFEFDDDEGESVYEDDDVGAFFDFIYNGPLVDDMESVVVDIGIIDEIDDGRLVFFSIVVFDLYTVLEVVGEEGVFLNKGPDRYIFYCIEGFFESGPRYVGIYSFKGREDLVFEEGGMVVPYDVRSVFVGVSEMIPEEFYDGVFKVVFGECHGFFSRGRGVFGDLVKYDIVDGRREKGCGDYI
jgi:hypothetical protein